MIKSFKIPWGFSQTPQGNGKYHMLKRSMILIPPIWTGGQNGPLRVFAKYLKNGLADLHETS